MKNWLKRVSGVSANQDARDQWVASVLATLPAGARVLDAGAGEQRYRKHCAHLQYVAQDFGGYDGHGNSQGLQVGSWNYGSLQIVSDITAIPEPAGSFDAIMCTEVLEHVPDPLRALDEFARLLRSGGQLIVTAPFASLVHFAPYHFSTGFSRYWYEHHLAARGLQITELRANGDWFSYLWQELLRLPSMGRRYRDWCWPWAYACVAFAATYFAARKLGRGSRGDAADLACFGFHVRATKR
jgi:ubiquinone/menaquinone biosynthesis C-methylase UbiE